MTYVHLVNVAAVSHDKLIATALTCNSTPPLPLQLFSAVVTESTSAEATHSTTSLDATAVVEQGHLDTCVEATAVDGGDQLNATAVEEGQLDASVDKSLSSPHSDVMIVQPEPQPGMAEFPIVLEESGRDDDKKDAG